MKVYGSIADLIGHTPILRLEHASRESGSEILVKAEFLNPGGSLKDRVALAMLRSAEHGAQLEPGSLVVEATAGNTGIGLAMLCAARGYRFVSVMSASDRGPKSQAMQAYGAEVVFADPVAAWDSDLGPLGIAARIAEERQGIFLNQFSNPANPETHALSTATEILDDLGCELDVLVAGIGSGGTITGLARTLKPSIPDLVVIGVAAETSYLGLDSHGDERISGITPDFEAPVFNREAVDGVTLVSTADAERRAQELAQKEGLWTGVSSGAVVEAAVREALKRPQSMVLAVLADTGRNTVCNA